MLSRKLPRMLSCKLPRMLSRKLPRTVFLAVFLVAPLIAFLVGAMMGWYSPSAPPAVPRYAAGDCVRKVDREPWEPEVWVRVLQVGRHSYLVDPQPYKRRSRFADMAAFTYSYEAMHRLTEKVPCPNRKP